MVSQTTVQDSNTILFGSAKVEVGDTLGTMVDVGAMDDVAFEETKDVVTMKFDNTGDFKKYIKNHRAKVTGTMYEMALEKMKIMRGDIDNFATVLGTEVTLAGATHEKVTLTGTEVIALANRNGDKTVVNITAVKQNTDTTPATYVVNSDYVVVLLPDGRTGIARTTGSTIASGATVRVEYKYTPASGKKLSTGGKVTITPKVMRITNVNELGKIFQITMFKASNEDGMQITYNAQDSDKANGLKLTVEAICDPTRPVGEQLFEIYSEQFT